MFAEFKNFFHFDEYKKTLDEALQVQMRQAAREWLRAVIPAVPVWTGTARGTLQPLGRYLRVAVPISPVKQLPGRGPDFGASQAAFNFTSGDGIYTFEYDINLFYYQFNEFNNAQAAGFHLKQATPWQSFTKGDEAFNNYIEQVMPKRIPNWTDFIESDTLVVES